MIGKRSTDRSPESEERKGMEWLVAAECVVMIVALLILIWLVPLPA